VTATAEHADESSTDEGVVPDVGADAGVAAVPGFPEPPLSTSAWTRLVQLLGRTRALAMIVPHTVSFDIAVYRRTGGRFSPLGRHGLPQLLLTTVGRKSGQPRTVPLLYRVDAGDAVLLGTNLGRAPHPAWTVNLLAQPRASVEIGRTRTEVVARLVEPGPERDRLVAMMVEIYPGYSDYLRRLDRVPRVFRLTPVADGTPAEPTSAATPGA
jgi:deazaflavin-dependent oxidoreductase (nitroreductase family)